MRFNYNPNPMQMPQNQQAAATPIVMVDVLIENMK